MTVKRGLITLPLLFCAIFASVVVLTSSARAETKHVTFAEPVTIGQTVLKPGDYAVKWIGQGPEVMVTFLNVDDEVVATAPARLVMDKSPQRSIVTLTMPDNSKVLKQLVFRHLTLVFDITGQMPEP